MHLQETAMDSLNRMTTDIEECPKCDSENLNYLDSGSSTEEGCLDWRKWKCKECAYVFITDV